MLLGHARGKVGSLVFSRQNGKQVTRAKAETVRNPQTEKQIVQRIILNTISQAYSRMAAITDHSFEGKSNPSENMAAFMKRNMNELRSKISKAVDAGNSFEEITNFAPIGTSNFVYNPLVISMGALPKIPVISVTSGTGAKTGAITANTYQAVIDAFGLQRGDQLTFVNIVEDAQGNKYFYYSRVILNPVDAEGNNLPLSTAFINQGAIVSPSPRNEGQFAALNFDTTGITFAVGNKTVKAAAVIVSREKGDGSYARSEATLVLDENAIDESVDMCTLQDAIDQFQENGVGLDNSKYLNNASSKGSAAGGSGSQGGGGSTGGGGSNPSTLGAPTIKGNTPFTESTQVTITAAEGATIKYTTDGSNPTSASSTYNSPLTLNATTTVKAIAIKDGKTSSVASKVFTKSKDDMGTD